jgi:hypothetical protein
MLLEIHRTFSLGSVIPLFFKEYICTANALEDGLQLHLSTLATTTYGYRLSAEATDNNQTKFTSIASIVLSPVGMIKVNNPRHLNTIILKIKD